MHKSIAPGHLREEVRICRQIARCLNLRAEAAVLLRLAEGYERQAAALEARPQATNRSD